MSSDGQPPDEERDGNTADSGGGDDRDIDFQPSTSGRPENETDSAKTRGFTGEQKKPHSDGPEEEGLKPDDKLSPDDELPSGIEKNEMSDRPEGNPEEGISSEEGTGGLSTGRDAYYDDPYDDAYEHSDGDERTPSETKSLEGSVSTIPPPPPDEGDDGDGAEDEAGMARMSFLEHLEELRTRIIQSVIGLTLAYLGSLVFAKQLFSYVKGPIQRSFDLLNEMHGFDPPLHLVAITPQEQFHLIYLKVPLLAAVFVAAPWLTYQAWAFISPGLYQRERRWAKPFIFCIAGLFVLGGLFGYFVVLKFALTFLLGIGIDSDIRPMISVSSYFSTFVIIELGLGIVFQMPVLIFFLTLLRIVDPTFLLGNVRYAILIIFVIAAVVTPTPDVFNMILFAAPMILLFYVGIAASFLLVAKRERGRIPWVRILLIVLLILMGLIASIIYFMHTQLGYEFVDGFPWLVPPPE